MKRKLSNCSLRLLEGRWMNGTTTIKGALISRLRTTKKRRAVPENKKDLGGQRTGPLV